MDYCCDKRNDRHFKINGKHYRIMTDLLTYNDKTNEGVILVNKPNLTALYLNISDKAISEAKTIFNEIIIPNLSFNNKEGVFVVNLDSGDSIVFDLLESVLVSVIFAYTAVEAFVNSIIPLDYKEQRQIKGEIKIVDLRFIQRNINMDEKIKKILPKIFNYTFSGKKVDRFWTRFSELEKFRDELIHLKREELIGNRSTQLGFLMYNVSNCIKEDIIESARELIGFISDKIGDHTSIPYEFNNE